MSRDHFKTKATTEIAIGTEKAKQVARVRLAVRILRVVEKEFHAEVHRLGMIYPQAAAVYERDVRMCRHCNEPNCTACDAAKCAQCGRDDWDE